MADMVRVVLGDDFYQGESYYEDPRGDYEVPREQVQRWAAAVEAYQAMQGEIAALMDERVKRLRAERAAEERQAQEQRAATVTALRGTFSRGGT